MPPKVMVRDYRMTSTSHVATPWHYPRQPPPMCDTLTHEVD